jgi:hypothetical protein
MNSLTTSGTLVAAAPAFSFFALKNVKRGRFFLSHAESVKHWARLNRINTLTAAPAQVIHRFSL